MSRVGYLVDGRRFEGRRGESLLEALRREGFEVPSLCHHAQLEPAGNCRLCLVEVERRGKRRVTTSCNYPLLEGTEVFLDTERVKRLRRGVLQLLLAMAPRDEAVKKVAERYGVGETPFAILSASDNCILCGLCVRVCRQVVGKEAISLGGRGEKKHLGRRPLDEFPTECIGCGACAFVCPTGAISMEEVAVERLRSRWGERRPCRYALLGLLPGSVCESDYRCATCEIDQRMFDLAAPEHPAFLRLGAREREP